MLQHRKSDYIPDTRTVCQKHHQTVDSNSLQKPNQNFSPGWWSQWSMNPESSLLVLKATDSTESRTRFDVLTIPAVGGIPYSNAVTKSSSIPTSYASFAALARAMSPLAFAYSAAAAMVALWVCTCASNRALCTFKRSFERRLKDPSKWLASRKRIERWYTMNLLKITKHVHNKRTCSMGSVNSENAFAISRPYTKSSNLSTSPGLLKHKMKCSIRCRNRWTSSSLLFNHSSFKVIAKLITYETRGPRVHHQQPISIETSVVMSYAGNIHFQQNCVGWLVSHPEHIPSMRFSQWRNFHRMIHHKRWLN
jgi:hypothetical protein